MDEGKTETANEAVALGSGIDRQEIANNIGPLNDGIDEPDTADDIEPLDDGIEKPEDLLANITGPEPVEAAIEAQRGGGFGRHLEESFIQRLGLLAEQPGWWRDALADRELFIATRGRYINVYWRGQSLFMATHVPDGDQLTVSTHPKFLMDPNLERQVRLENNTEFRIQDLQQNGFMRTYVDSQSATDGHGTLWKMKRASGIFAGSEKIGCHQIAINNNNSVLDCEIQLPNFAGVVGVNANQGARIDLVSVEKSGNNATLVFWEAKHYKNNELRAPQGQTPPVVSQIERYRDYLNIEIENINRSYEQVARNLVALEAMGQVRTLSNVIREVGNGTRTLLTETGGPKVGLVVFGYDDAQRQSTRWAETVNVLRTNIELVIAIGNASQLILTTTTANRQRKNWNPM